MLQGELAQEAPASGTADPIVSLAMSEHYRAAARDAGDHQVSLKKVHHADHVDMIEPPSPIWLQVVERIIEQCE
jgi:pimeloyl-ACP methyl ester carboxylesterase